MRNHFLVFGCLLVLVMAGCGPNAAKTNASVAVGNVDAHSNPQPDRTTTASPQVETTTTSPQPETTAASGFVLESPEGNFSVRFPVQPEQRDVPTAAGNQRRLYTVALHDGALVYSLQYAEGVHPDDVDEALVQAQARIVLATQGTLLKESEIQLGDWHGRAFSFSFSSNTAPGLQFTRIFFGDGRIYILTLTGHPDFAKETEADVFLNSFAQLKPNKEI